MPRSNAKCDFLRKCAFQLAVIFCVAVGCTQPTTLKEGPVSVPGKLTKAGQPVGDVMVWFQPLDHGHLASFAVRPDGQFQSELVPGNYAYYVAKSTGPKADAAWKRIDPKFWEPDLTRTVAVESGQELAIALD